VTTTNKIAGVLEQGWGRSRQIGTESITGKRSIGKSRSAASTLLFLVAAATFATGCAGDLEGNPDEYTKATGGGGPSFGGGPSIAGANAGGTGGSGTAGTAPTAGTGSMVPPDPACVAQVFQSRLCSTCHSPVFTQPEAKGGLDLDGTNLGMRLSTTTAKYAGVTVNPAACKPGALIIDPVNNAESILLKKVNRTQACGTEMPQGTGLSGADLKCIEDWVNSF
jgi:hypothetical protein